MTSMPGHDDAATVFLQQLVRRSRDGESAIQADVAARLHALGCRVERLRYRPADIPLVEEFAAGQSVPPQERESVIGIVRGTGGGRSLMLFAHPDPEPVSGLDSWRHDPFAADIQDGRLYGWGVADDLCGVAMMTEGLCLALADGWRPGGDIIVASTPSKQHARGVAAILHHGYSADAAVYLHPAESGVGMREIKAFASGQLEFRIHVAGRLPQTSEPAHTAFAHQAVNPLDKAVLIYQALRGLDAERGARIRHPALQEAVGRSTNLQISVLHCGDGQRLSRLAERCTLGCALSFPPPERLDDLRRAVEAAIAAAADADPWLRDNRPEIEWIAGVGAAETPAEHPLYQMLAAAIHESGGPRPHVNPLHTASDIRNPIIQKGIPTVGFGPRCGDLVMADGHDEWVDLADYRRAVAVTAAMIRRWCGAA